MLLGTADVREVWRSGEPAESGQRNRVHFRRSENLLFGCIAVPETALPEARSDAAAPGTAGAPSALHGATVGAYRDIYATLDAVGYPHLLRVWNYLPDINLDSHGSERYRQFNSARQAALRAAGQRADRQRAGGLGARRKPRQSLCWCTSSPGARRRSTSRTPVS